MSERKPGECNDFHTPELPEQELSDLVCEIETAIGRREAGTTPFGKTIIYVCETALAWTRYAGARP